jgi:hypothetical protein
VRKSLLYIFRAYCKSSIGTTWMKMAAVPSKCTHSLLASRLVILPLGDWTSYPVIYGSLVRTELIILTTSMLLSPKYRRLLILVAILLFHGLLGFSDITGVPGISIFMYMQITLFLPAAPAMRCLAGVYQRLDKMLTTRRRRIRLLGLCIAIPWSVVFAVLLWTAHQDNDPQT